MPSITTLTFSTHLVLNSENISATAIQVRWVANPSSELANSDGKQSGAQNNCTSQSQIPGFKMKWKLQGATELVRSVPEANYEWNRSSHPMSNKKDQNMMIIMNYVRESQRKGLNESDVWKTLLRHRWDIEILKTNPCLNETQASEVIFKTGQDLNLSYDWNLWIPEEDLRLDLLSSQLPCRAGRTSKVVKAV